MMAVGEFRKKIRERKPTVSKVIEDNALKRKIAFGLRALRKDCDLTQAEVGELSGLTQSAISRLESPVGPTPSIQTLLKYVQACGRQIGFKEPERASGFGASNGVSPNRSSADLAEALAI